jgi:hypothetical protein
VEDSKDVEEPQGHADDDDVENGLDGALYGDVVVHEPEKDAYDDESDGQLDQGHEDRLPEAARLLGKTIGRKPGACAV